MDTGSTRVKDAAINRSLYAYLANPEAERRQYEDETDTTMTLLRFKRAKDGKDIGVLTWFPVHGTSLLGNNTHAAADNKGVAAWLLEEAMRENTNAAEGFVAGFSQASVGDTTPNVLGAYCDDGSGQQCSLKNSTCADGKSQKCHGRGPEFAALDLGVKSCHEIGRRQFAGAQNVYVGRPILARFYTFLHIHIYLCTPLRVAWQTSIHITCITQALETDLESKTALGTSRTAIVGSTVKAFHFFHDMRFWNFTLPNGQQAQTCPAALGYSFAAGTSDWPGLFDFTQGDSGNPDANPIWKLVSGLLRTPTKAQAACQGSKPILLDVGEINEPYPWAPNIVDIQMLRVGQFVIIVSPSEATTMSGRRWKAAVAKEAATFLTEKPIVVLGGPANSYAHYCATPEEYEVQRYEGASTLFGPHELNAYINLTLSNMHYLRPDATSVPEQGVPAPDNRGSVLSFTPGVIVDNAPLRRSFGQVLRQPDPSYKVGSVVQVTFQGANPRNNLRLEGTFAAIEQQKTGGDWAQVKNDADWFLVYSWRRTNSLLGYSEVDVSWETYGNAVPGTYRVKYYGDAKHLFGKIDAFEGTSTPFTLT